MFFSSTGMTSSANSWVWEQAMPRIKQAKTAPRISNADIKKLFLGFALGLVFARHGV